MSKFDSMQRIINVIPDCIYDAGMHDGDVNYPWVILSDDIPLDFYERVYDAFDRIGADIYHIEDAGVCGNCHALIETQMTHNGWRPDFLISNGEYICGDCARKNPDDYIEDYVNNGDNAAGWIEPSDLEEYGWQIESEQNLAGMSHYSVHDPNVKMNELREEYPDHDIVFVLEGAGQFQTYYTAMMRPSN